jgi:Ca2+-binding EF-hand superfamily protein
MNDRWGRAQMVDYEEFCRVVMVEPKEFEGIIRRIGSRLLELKRKGQDVLTTFEMFDLNGSGFISLRDFKEAAKQLQLPATESQLQVITRPQAIMPEKQRF